jgi:hypothetical protein
MTTGTHGIYPPNRAYAVVSLPFRTQTDAAEFRWGRLDMIITDVYRETGYNAVSGYIAAL